MGGRRAGRIQVQVLKALLLVAQVDAENVTAAPRLHGLRKEAEKAKQKIGWRAELTPHQKRRFPKFFPIF